MTAILPDKLKKIAGIIPQSTEELAVWGNKELPEQASFGLALGFFDGVHKGHRALLDRLLWHCKEPQLCSAVYTFDELPKASLIGTAGSGSRIQNAQRRAAYILDEGIDFVFEQVFTPAIQSLEPETFVDYLCQRLRIKYIVVGDDFRFGKARKGDSQLLKSLAEKHGTLVEAVAQVQGGGQAISSSRIRALLKEGRIEEANRLLGHPFSIVGTVIRGRGLARTWGMPTCNMRLDPEQLVLPFGVYASRTRIGRRYYNSISNIGLRPTLNANEKEPLLETYLFDMSADLYDQELEVFILKFQREESHFAKLEEMVEVMRDDISDSRTYLAEQERLQPVGKACGIPYYHLATTRFTQAYLHFCLSIPADSRKNSARSLAMRMVLQASAAYPGRQAFSLAQDEQYGASLDAYNDNEGERQAFEFTVEGITRGMHDETPFQNATLLLFHALRKPLLDANGLFDESLFLTEQNNLLTELKSRMQNKAKYAYDRSFSLLLDGLREGISPKGDPDVIPTLTREEVTQAWFELLREARAAVYVAGNLPTTYHDVLLHELEAFATLNRKVEAESQVRLLPSSLKLEEAREASEYKDIEQTRLVMYWSGLEPFPLIKGSVLNVLNSLYGADSHSLLFEMVRETHGLAYSIHSQVLRHLSMLMVSAGINGGQIDQAIEDCRNQLQAICEGKFSERHFQSSVAMVESKLLALSDSLHGQLLYQMNALEAGHPQDSKEALEALATVRPEDVSTMASGLREAFVYKLLPLVQPEVGVE